MRNCLSPATVFISIRVCLPVLFAICQPLYGWKADSVLQPVRYLRVAIHVFQDDAGYGNFPEDSVHTGFLHQLVEWANHRLANLDTLKPSVSSSFIADTRVRIRLDTVFYHQDSKAWDCSRGIEADYMREKYVDGDTSLNYQQKYQTLPIFIGANNPVAGGNSLDIGDRGYIAVRGYFENFLSQALPLAIDECGRNLVHELGHCLGLSHNFSGGPGGDQCDTCIDNGCPVEGTSNNIMDYWPAYGYAISKCQFDQIHFCLSGGRGNISEVVINDSCYRVSGIGFRVSEGDTLLVGDTVYMHTDLIISNGGVLKVHGYLSMPSETTIEVEPGGRVEIDGGTIGNLCGDLWSGIRISPVNGVRPAHVSIIRGGMLENALAGLKSAGRVETVFERPVFQNCVESVVFLAGSSDYINLNNSIFRITHKLNHYEDGLTPSSFINAEGIAQLVVTGCNFINEPGPGIFDADWMGTGISAEGQSLQVKDSRFVNLTTGLDLSGQDPHSRIHVTGNSFVHNRIGIRTCFAGIHWISDNSFILQRFNSGSTIGLFLVTPDRFAISHNRFESVYGGGKMAGIALSHPTTETSPVFNNEFTNLPVGVFIDGSPAIESGLFRWAGSSGSPDSLKLGPQVRFNQFDSVAMQLALVVDSTFGTAVGVSSAVRPEYSIRATRWSPGSFSWYDDQIPMVAFHGWKPETKQESDHGLYWFMNYLGLQPYGFEEPEPLGWNELADYLLKLMAIDNSEEWIPYFDVYEILGRIVAVPAAARSAKLSEYWGHSHPEDQTWLHETLVSAAGKFSNPDSLLTHLGTGLALKNLDDWKVYKPEVRPLIVLRKRSGPAPGFVLPDLDVFRFGWLKQAQSSPPAFSLYPTPALDFVLIRLHNGYSYTGTWDGTLISVDGQHSKRFRIESWEDQKVDISSLPAGVYVMELSSGIQYLGAVKFVKITHR